MQERYSPKTLAYRLKSISWMLFTICITSAICVAQIDRAAFTGTVTDATGAVIQHAQVQVVDLATGLKSEAQTNSKGAYLVPGLAVGTYAVSISHEGFGMVSFQNVLLEVGLTRVLNAALRVSIPGEKVQVEASQPLEQTSPEVSGVINEQQIKEIPINGRDWATLLVLAPGAIDDGGGDQRTIRFAGRGRDDNNYMIDGVDATQAQKSTTRLQISEDAISEYRVSSALYSAEYGAGAGGQVDTRLQSGGWSHPRFRNITARPKASSLVHSGKIAAPIPAARIANHSPRRIISNWCQASDMLRLWSESPSSTALRSACFMTRSASSISARRF